MRIGVEINIFLKVLNTSQHRKLKFQDVFFQVSQINKMAIFE